MRRRHKQAGMSLLEVLVSVVVFSVGVMGVASLMLTSWRNNDATLSRTQSTILANEIYEKMLANLPAAESGNYNLSMSTTLPVTTQLDCASNTANCSPAQVAAWDLAQWGARAQRVLPRADAAISVNSESDPLTIQVRVRFDALREIDGRTTETYTFRAR